MTDGIEAQLRNALQATFPDGSFEIALDGNRALLQVTSSAFAGLSRVKQQQAVYGAIGAFVTDGSLHAVTIKTQTPGS
ncbi:MAG: BolA/IbaG family iron-sulfur metabolism protein [Pseudomonadota bacterium]